MTALRVLQWSSCEEHHQILSEHKEGLDESGDENMRK